MAEPASPNPKKLLGQLRDAISIKHYAYATQETYVHWAKRTILFHNKRHPAEMGVPEIEAFLSHLAQEDHVSASTQNQAFNALLFLYRNVLKVELATPIHALRAKRAQSLPTVCVTGRAGLHIYSLLSRQFLKIAHRTCGAAAPSSGRRVGPL